MGASRIDSICNKLIENGMDPETPVAAIENGTLPKQRTLTAPLNVVAKEFKKQNFHAPVIIIVSQTVSFRDDISWYETKPLHNKKVVIAGNGEASTSLNNMLYELGADIQHLQVIKTRINFPDINLREIFSNTNFDWILFTSENGAKYFFGVLKENHLDSRIFGSMKIACVGLGTKNILETHGLTADYTSENFKPGSFKKEFLIKHNIRDKILLRVEDDYPYDKIYEELNRQGSTVQKLNLYNSISNQPDDELIKDLQKHHPDILIFTSPCSTVNFFSVLGLQAAADILKNCGAVLADPVIPEALLKKNLYNAKISTSLSDKNIRDIVNKLI
jgi:uroporphyrinogen III methyltransferase/synthase